MRTMRLMTLLIALAALAAGQTIPNAVIAPQFQKIFLDANGRPLPGGKVFSCVVGTAWSYPAGCASPLATYTDSTAGTPNSNPIVLTASGSANIWIGPNHYKFILTNSVGVVQATVDNVVDETFRYLLQITLVGSSSLISYVAPGAGAVARSVHDRLAGWISVMDFGAIGDGSFHPVSGWCTNHGGTRYTAANDPACLAEIQTDYPSVTAVTNEIDGAASQAALDASTWVVFPAGTYIIDGDGLPYGESGGIAPRSNTTISCAGGATLQEKPTSAGSTSSTGYQVLRIANVSNVRVLNCVIQGDRYTHIGTIGEYGYGIGIFGSTNVWLESTTTRDAWGDGIVIDAYMGSITSTNIHGSNVLSTNNRRHGASVISADGVVFDESTFSYQAIMNGVDVEPGPYGYTVTNVRFVECHFSHNAGRGFVAQGEAPPYMLQIIGIQVLGGTSDFNAGEGVVVAYQVADVLISGMQVRNNGGNGIYAYAGIDGILILGNTVTGNGTAGNPSIGVFNINISLTDKAFVIGNTVRAGTNAIKPLYGVAVGTSTGTLIMSNDLRGSGDTGDIFEVASTGTLDYFSQKSSGPTIKLKVCVEVRFFQLRSAALPSVAVTATHYTPRLRCATCEDIECITQAALRQSRNALRNDQPSWLKNSVRMWTASYVFTASNTCTAPADGRGSRRRRPY